MKPSSARATDVHGLQSIYSASKDEFGRNAVLTPAPLPAYIASSYPSQRNRSFVRHSVAFESATCRRVRRFQRSETWLDPD
jgi:hypothetical protein